MERHFDEELKELNKDILKMATMAQESIHKVIEALRLQDAQMAKNIIDLLA